MWRQIVAGVVVGPICWLVAAGVAMAAEPSSTSVALSALFSPHRSPGERTMGLVQRSFLDLVEESQPRLQIALVIDGTESMAAEMDGLRQSLGQMIGDLRRYRGQQVEFQLVVYRDAGATSGEVIFPLAIPNHEFTGDLEKVLSAAAGLKVETGAPYFPELIDLGIHQAITELGWSQDQDTSRWLLVFGDAPPYAAGFDEPATGARRRYETDMLVSVAKRAGVRINCVLCRSRESERTSYEKTLSQTQEFMNALATRTDGLMLDLSYPDVYKALEQAMNKAEPQYAPVAVITQDDVDRLRATFSNKTPGPVRVAIAPHAAFADDIDDTHPGVLLAAELQHKLSNVEGLELTRMDDVTRLVKLLQAQGVRKNEQVLFQLAQQLDAQYVIWGEYQTQNNRIGARSRLYRATTTGVEEVTAPVVTEAASGDEMELASRHLQKLLNAATQQRRPNAAQDALLGHFTAFLSKPADQTRATFLPVANRPDSRTQILTAFRKLEESLAYKAGDPQAAPLLADAERLLTSSLQVDEDRQNYWAYWLLANCYLNQIHQHREESERQMLMNRFAEALTRAYLYSSEGGCPEYERKEIEAGFYLLVPQDKDVARAAQLYAELARPEGRTNWETARRATWMLSGIYAGDFGVEAADPDHKVVDLKKSREELVKLLAFWEESPEARIIKQEMRWDPARGETLHPYRPGTLSDFQVTEQPQDSQ
ncbi:MAG: vWA domain-containing protein [Pirellulales bacterium]